MYLTTGSIIDFQISFTIPINNQFDHIVIADQLANGLNYTTGDAKIYINNSTTALIAGTDYVDSPTITSGITTISLNITNQSITKPTAVTTVTAVIPAKISNYGLLTNPITNKATITGYDALNNTIATSDTAATSTTLDSSKFYGFGTAYDALKQAGENVYLVYQLPALDSGTNSELVYTSKLTAHPALTLSSSTAPEVGVYINGVKTLITPITANIDSATGIATVSYSHTGAMAGHSIYIAIAATTNSNITSITDNYINTPVTAQIIYTPALGSPITVATLTNFTVNTNLSAAAPVFGSPTKIVLTQPK